MPSLRLLADDLTGALDTAAEFVGLCGPVEVRWADRLPAITPESLAIDSGTRECTRAKAAEIVRGLAPLLHDGTIAYKKVDSLMRGAWPGELAACFGLGAWRHCVMAPAFPYQERRTQGGRQFARSGDGSWSAAGADIATELRAEGLVAVKAGLTDTLADGISIFDAETEEDLDRVVAVGRSAPGPVIWCGSGGLARALARGHNVRTSRRLKKPVLGLFGSDHPATAAQLSACQAHWADSPPVAKKSALSSGGWRRPASLLSAPAVGRRVARRGGEPDRRRYGSVAKFAAAGDRHCRRRGNPQTAVPAGRHAALLATAQVAPGMPRSLMQGGVWDGVEIVSKSGAFGARRCSGAAF